MSLSDLLASTHETYFFFQDQAQSACFSKGGEVIIIAMTSGKWMVLDSNTREIYGLFQDGSEALHTVRYSPDGKFLALGSRDGILYIYQVSEDFKKYHRMGRCLVSKMNLLTYSAANSKIRISCFKLLY